MEYRQMMQSFWEEHFDIWQIEKFIHEDLQKVEFPERYIERLESEWKLYLSGCILKFPQDDWEGEFQRVSTFCRHLKEVYVWNTYKTDTSAETAAPDEPQPMEQGNAAKTAATSQITTIRTMEDLREAMKGDITDEDIERFARDMWEDVCQSEDVEECAGYWFCGIASMMRNNENKRDAGIQPIRTHIEHARWYNLGRYFLPYIASMRTVPIDCADAATEQWIRERMKEVGVTAETAAPDETSQSMEQEQPQQAEKTPAKGRPVKPFAQNMIDDTDGMKLQRLHSIADGKQGKDFALVMVAGMKVGWLTKPTYIQCRKEFGDIGTQQGFSQYLTLSKFTTEEINGMTSTLEK